MITHYLSGALASVVLMAGSSAIAAQHMEKAGPANVDQAELNRIKAREQPSAGKSMRDVLLFPERAVVSVVRTPLIVSDTMRGKRELFDPMPTWRKEQLAEGNE